MGFSVLDSSGGDWKITYSGSSTDGKFLVGSLILLAKRWLVILNANGFPIEGKCLENGEVLSVGSVVRFPSHLARINDILPPTFDFLGTSHVHACKGDDLKLMWHVTCSTLSSDVLDNSPGFLVLYTIAKRIVLLNCDKVVIDARFLLQDEKVSSGVILDLVVKRVMVGEQIFDGPISSTKHKYISVDFSKGRMFEDNMFKKFGHHINFSGGFRRRPFFLVGSFGRANFKIDIHTIGIVLQSCFGGHASK